MSSKRRDRVVIRSASHRKVVFYLRDRPEWQVTAELQHQGGVYVVSRCTIEPLGAATPLGGMPTVLLRDIPIGGLPQIVARSKQRTGSNKTLAELVTLLDGPGAAKRLARPKASGRRGYPDDHYAMWAQRYVEALRQYPNPIPWLARKHSSSGMTEQNLRDWLSEARRRGLLTPAPPGRAGGELTAKALKILSGRGQ